MLRSRRGTEVAPAFLDIAAAAVHLPDATALDGELVVCVPAHRPVLLGRYDDQERLQYIGRTTTLPQTVGTTVAELRTVARHGHPWTGWSFAAGWGSRETLGVTLTEPDLVVEVGPDVARDTVGRWRHPARRHRPRTDLTPADVPRTTASA